jgi:hypothetical protein
VSLTDVRCASLWALWAAPLIVATEIRNMTDDKRSILLNAEVIAVNQDPLGVAGDLVANVSDAQVWSKPLTGGAQAVVLFNNDNYFNRNVTVTWSQLGWQDGHQIAVRDLWVHKDMGLRTDGCVMVVAMRTRLACLTAPLQMYRYWAVLEPRGAAMIKLSPQQQNR